MNFRRYYIPGSTIFITQVVHGRRCAFHEPANINLLCEILRNVKAIHPFAHLGYVTLPDHFHMIIQPTGESNFSQIMHSLKTNFTREYKRQLGLASSESIKFWQKRFWAHVIRNDRDLENHLHYIHYNPVKHGLVKDLHDWLDRSYSEWERRGLSPFAFTWKEPKDMNGSE